MAGESPKILVIDDDEITRRLLAALLQGGGYRVLLAEGPAQGLEAATRQNPDLIILDVYMPDMDGWGVLANLRAIPTTSKTPVIMLTVADTIKNTEEAFNLGANAYLVKPLNPALLHKKVAEFLENRPPSNS